MISTLILVKLIQNPGAENATLTPPDAHV